MSEQTENNEAEGSFSTVNLTGMTEVELLGHEILLEKRYELSNEQGSEQGRKTNALNGGKGQSRGITSHLEPRYSFEKLGALPDISPLLKTCIDTMATNISRFGHHFVPVYDVIEGKKVLESGKEVSIKVNRDTGEEIPEDVLKTIHEDFIKAVTFFASASIDLPFDELMYQKHINLETYGNAFWEVENNLLTGEPMGINQIKTESMRMMALDDKPIKVDQRVINPITFEWIIIPRWKRFRRFIQFTKGGKKLYYKEFGDPRQMNAHTGEYAPLDEAFNIPRDGSWLEATEILHWKIYSPRDDYGSPRYVSRTPHILGTRAADLVNYALLRNNAIPPAVVIVEGFKSDEIDTQIKEWVKTKRGMGQSFTSLLILQAGLQSTSVGPGSKPVKPSIRIEPLTQILTKDGMFIQYIKNNDEGIVGTFRLTNQFVGMTADINRATAEVADEIVQKQVFIPERNLQDMIINSFLMNALGIRYWKYETKAVRIENSKERSELAVSFAQNGALTFRELRRICKEVLDIQLEEIEEKHMDLTLPQFKALTENGVVLSELVAEGDDVRSPAENAPDYNDLEPDKIESSGSAQDSAEIQKDFHEVNEGNLLVQLVKKLVEMREGIEIQKSYLMTFEEEDSMESAL